MKTLSVAFFIAGFVAAFIAGYRQKKREERQQAILENALSDEGMLKSQLEFEKHIEQQIGLPDAISGRSIYIYRNLIKVWFNELSARSRYQEEKKLKKVKLDFLRYMENLENEARYQYLVREGDENKKDQSETELRKSSGMVRAMEEGFAAAIGLKAVAELSVTRELPYDEFNDYGEKAPNGYYYEIDFAKREKYLRSVATNIAMHTQTRFS